MEGLSDRDRHFAQQLLKYIWQNDKGLDFRNLNSVNISYYNTIIKHPMCLDKIKTKLARGKYYCLEEVVSDIDLIWKNCRKFNDLSSTINLRAEVLENLTKEYIRDHYSKDKRPVTKQQMISLSEKIGLSSKGEYTKLINYLQAHYPLAIKNYDRDLYMIRIDFLPLSAYPEIEENLR